MNVISSYLPFFHRISPTRRSTGTSHASCATSAARLWWTSSSAPRPTGSTAGHATTRSSPPGATVVETFSEQVRNILTATIWPCLIECLTAIVFYFLGMKKMEYKTRQWHEKCFVCCTCKNPIGTKSFIPKEHDIYCAKCYEDKFATKCIKCNKARYIFIHSLFSHGNGGCWPQFLKSSVN